MRKEVNANAAILITTIILDVVVLGVFLMVKASNDMMVIYAALIGMFLIFSGERIFLQRYKMKKIR